MTLRARFALAASAAVTCSVALLAVVVFFAERQELLRIADTDLHREAANLSDDLLGRPGPLHGAIDIDLVRPYELRGQLVSGAGRVTSLQAEGTTLPVDDRVLAVAAGTTDRFVSEAVLDGATYRVLTVPAPGGVLMVGRSTEDVQHHLASFATALALIVVAGLGLALLLGALIAHVALRSITRLSAAAEGLAAGRTLHPGSRSPARTSSRGSRAASTPCWTRWTWHGRVRVSSWPTPHTNCAHR